MDFPSEYIGGQGVETEFICEFGLVFSLIHLFLLAIFYFKEFF